MERSRHLLFLPLSLVALLVFGAALVGGSVVRAEGGSHAGLAGTISFESDTGLFSVDLSTGEVRSIPGTWAGDGHPVWSRDGTRLLFDREQDVNGTASDVNVMSRDVYVMNADGSSLRQLTSNPGDDEWAKWSPDGRSIVFQSKRPYRTSVYAMNVRTGAARYVAYGFFPSWRIDRRILFTNVYGDIQTVRPYGAELKTLPNQPGIDAVESAVPSPDGKTIAYIANTAETNSYGMLYTARADGSKEKALVAGDGEAEDPAWSPDGKWIAYDYRSAEGASDIYVINRDGTDKQQITHTGNAYRPGWRTEPR